MMRQAQPTRRGLCLYAWVLVLSALLGAGGCASLPRPAASPVSEILATPGLPPEAAGPQMERALEGLALTPEQARQASAVTDQWQFQMTLLRADRRDLMDRLVRAFGQDPIDRTTLERLQSEAAQLTDAALARTTEALLKLEPILSPQQRAQLAAQWLAGQEAPLSP